MDAPSLPAHFSASRHLWSPPRPSSAFASTLRRHINFKRNLFPPLENYHDLHRYSVENWSFWIDLCESLGIIFSVPPREDNILVSPGPLLPEIPLWFPGARLNYAENLLHRRDDGIALIESGEQFITPSNAPNGYRAQTVTYRELHSRVHLMTSALLTHGLKVGDRVAAITTNSTTSVVLALSVAAIGGIFSSTATDMGTQGVLDRYRQIKPKFLFAETGVVYAGKEVDLMDKVGEVVRDLAGNGNGLEKVVLLPSRICKEWGVERKLDSRGQGAVETFTLSEFLKTGEKLAKEKPLAFAQLPFNQPLFILYSSGTSGPPKCIVHSAGGVLVNTKKDMRLIFDASGDDTYFQYTTTGWMMWTLMLTGLACGSRVVLYDGSPFHPTIEAYLQFIRVQGVTSWGTSPRFLSEVQGRGISPGTIDGLRVISVTGAIVTAALFEWTMEAFGRHIHVVSTSGGTDICASFVTGTGDMAVHAGEIQVKSLGMKVEVFDEAGQNIESSGEAGELVCTRAHVSLPVMFWGDGKGEKLREAYYATYKGVWRQGDFAAVNPKTKGILIFGRSDGVLNPSGVRFGSGEIYSVLERFADRIEDTLCVGQRRPGDGDERVVLFVKMRAGAPLGAELVAEIRRAIRDGLSGRHVPQVVCATPEIPYTVNGKKVELAVKRILNGVVERTSPTIANPEALEWYRRFAQSKL